MERHAVDGIDVSRARAPEASPQREVLLETVDFEERAHAATVSAAA
jgi:hypothetical protein